LSLEIMERGCSQGIARQQRLAATPCVEISPLGWPSQLCGMDDSTRKATLVCGLEGATRLPKPWKIWC
jgi:hypothetical protein